MIEDVAELWSQMESAEFESPCETPVKGVFAAQCFCISSSVMDMRAENVVRVHNYFSWTVEGLQFQIWDVWVPIL